ncbi:hypothetical protein Tco_1112131 [Tanacetum coccineum]|uniref:Uncharacterized protein n=1 Tax=Tanacetum coccineum TaxID=301880 RepID=A0ABQ5INM3_9ASTR
MACSLPHTFDEIQALVTKLIDENIIRQKAIMELAVQFENASAAKSDFRKAYEKCYDITHESRALIDTFLKQESNKDYEMNLALYRKAAKIKKQIESKYGFLTEKEYQQLLQDEEVLRQTLEEEARAEKEVLQTSSLEKSKNERGLSKLKCWDLVRKDKLKGTSLTEEGLPHRRDSSLSRDRPRSRDRSCGIEESYGNTCSSYRTRARHGHHSRDRGRSRIMKRGRESESPLSRVSESGTSDGGHWKSKSKRHKPTDEDDLTLLWSCEELDPFTPRIRNFKSLRKTRMPNNVKTYDRTGDLEDHVKIFQAATQVERWVVTDIH